ncbi:MAG: PQQ-dependent sugar dehydrogenase [Nitrososphaeraceae archaeon]
MQIRNPYIVDRKIHEMMITLDRKILTGTLFLIATSIVFFLLGFSDDSIAYAVGPNVSSSNPVVSDPNLKIESVATGFDFPTGIAFLGNNDILLLEKNTGIVYRIIDGNITNPVIHLNVSSKDERGLLGIAVTGNGESKQDDRLVFLYYTYCPKVKANVNSTSQGCGNYVYRYKFDTENSKLIEPQLILTLPALPGPSHNGGVLELDDKDENLYVAIGDLQSTRFNKNQTGYDTTVQNIVNGTPPDGRAGILRLTQDGKPIGNGLLGEEYPLNLYFAYGVKNSFGIDVDPLSGTLWDTENGPQFGDEINLVEPGFNSGWEKVQGVWKLNQTKSKNGIYDETSDNVKLVDFDDEGKYSSPEFVWDKPVGPTALLFLASDKLGEEYENDIFVGSVKNGVVYHFDLDNDRKSLSLSGDLSDSVLNRKDNSRQITFGENFGIVTDLQVGPDGYLYIVSGNRGTDAGAIYRIVPNEIK